MKDITVGARNENSRGPFYISIEDISEIEMGEILDALFGDVASNKTSNALAEQIERDLGW